MNSINFPGLGIYFKNVGKSFNLFGLDIAYYGITMALAILAGIGLAIYRAKKTNQKVDNYIDIALLGAVFGIIGARLYYVLFRLDIYLDDPISIFNLRQGGMAIYGAIIAAVIVTVIYTRKKKLNLWLVLDTAAPCLILGQIIGRFGNFFNREAFGEWTNNIFRMEIPIDMVSDSSDITQKMLSHVITRNGIEFITVSPTFLYEAAWNLLVLIFLLCWTKHKRFDGEIFIFYIIGYGIGRVLIESLRTDQLLIPGTNLPVSQMLSIILMISGLFMLYYKKTKGLANKEKNISGEENEIS